MAYCETCDRMFSDQHALTQHKRDKVHPKDPQCAECGGVFKSEGALNQHIRDTSHTGNIETIESFTEKFSKIALENKWKPGSKAYNKNKGHILVAELEDIFAGLTKLEGLQSICEIVGVDPVPISVTQCEKAMSDIFINIEDLVNAARSGGEVRLFPSRRALADYSWREDKIFRREIAKRSALLRPLLIKMGL